MSDLKARVQLLDRNTGLPIGDVDIITSASEILYTNKNKTLTPMNGIDKGTSFEDTPINTILDKMLYPHISPEIKSIILSNGYDVDTPIYLEKGSILNSFTYTAKIYSGSMKGMDITMTINREDSSSKSESIHISSEPGEEYSVMFTIPALSVSSCIQIGIIDGDDIIYSDKLDIRFVEPAFVGFINPKALNDGELTDLNNISIYIDNAIRSRNSKKFISPKCDLKQFSRDDVTYDTKEKLCPFVMVPKTWDNIAIFEDLNGNNITNSYALLSEINISISGSSLYKYILFVSRQSFYNNESVLKTIRYRFILDEYEKEVALIAFSKRRNPILSGLTLESPEPLDDRTVVDTYGDLLQIQYPYSGLLVYVKDIKTFFRYDKDWQPASNTLRLIEKSSELTDDLGGWDDIVINVITGEIYKKSYNNKWEKWGSIGGGSASGSSTAQLRFRYEWSITDTYVNDDNYIDIVTHNGTAYYCKASNTSIEPSETSSSFWGVFASGNSGSSTGGGNSITSGTGDTSSISINLKVIEEV